MKRISYWLGRPLLSGLLAVCLNANAQQGNLLDLLKDVSDALTAPAGAQPQEIRHDTKAMQLLKALAAADKGVAVFADNACARFNTPSVRAKVDANWELGNFADASAGYYIAAHDIAVCAIGKASNNPRRIRIPDAFDMAGISLAMSALADQRGKMVSNRTTSSASQAVILLSANNTDENREMIGILTKAGLVGTASATVSTNDSPVTRTSSTVASQSSSNLTTTGGRESSPKDVNGSPDFKVTKRSIDPGGFDIIGIRKNMSASDVKAALEKRFGRDALKSQKTFSAYTNSLYEGVGAPHTYLIAFSNDEMEVKVSFVPTVPFNGQEIVTSVEYLIPFAKQTKENVRRFELAILEKFGHPSVRVDAFDFAWCPVRLLEYTTDKFKCTDQGALHYRRGKSLSVWWGSEAVDRAKDHAESLKTMKKPVL